MPAWVMLTVTAAAMVVVVLLVRFTLEDQPKRTRRTRLVQVGDVLVHPKHVIAVEPDTHNNGGAHKVRLHLDTGSIVDAYDVTAADAPAALERRRR